MRGPAAINALAEPTEVMLVRVPRTFGARTDAAEARAGGLPEAEGEPGAESLPPVGLMVMPGMAPPASTAAADWWRAWPRDWRVLMTEAGSAASAPVLTPLFFSAGCQGTRWRFGREGRGADGAFAC